MKVSQKTIIKTCLLGIASLIGLANYIALYIIGKKIKSKILITVSLISPVIAIFSFSCLAYLVDEEVLISLLVLLSLVSIFAASVLIIVNLKRYMYADMLLEYVEQFGIDLEILEPIEPTACKITMVINSQVRDIAKILFKDMYYSVFAKIESYLIDSVNFDNDVKSKMLDEKINLPIGDCFVVGDEEKFNITIFSEDGKKYDFNVVDGNVIDCLKNGMSSKKVYGVR